MKSITIAGNCTRDAELRTTQSGQNVAGFSIAVNGFSKGAKTVDYFDVSVWGKRGESVIQFAKKGAKMCVTGNFYTDEYNGKTKLCIDASDFTPMGGGSEGGSQQSGGGYDSGSGGYDGGSRDLDDSIPF
jgi:single-strand DNA-binding protein